MLKFNTWYYELERAHEYKFITDIVTGSDYYNNSTYFGWAGMLINNELINVHCHRTLTSKNEPLLFNNSFGHKLTYVESTKDPEIKEEFKKKMIIDAFEVFNGD